MRNQPAIARQPAVRTLLRIARAACAALVRAAHPRLTPAAAAALPNLRIDVWAAVLGVNDSHDTHVHEGSVCSGVLYIDPPEGAAPLVFHDPRGAATHFPDLPEALEGWAGKAKDSDAEAWEGQHKNGDAKGGTGKSKDSDAEGWTDPSKYSDTEGREGMPHYGGAEGWAGKPKNSHAEGWEGQYEYRDAGAGRDQERPKYSDAAAEKEGEGEPGAAPHTGGGPGAASRTGGGQGVASRTGGVEAAFSWWHTSAPFSPRVAVLPTQGRMVVFPSFLAHQVLARPSGSSSDAYAEGVPHAGGGRGEGGAGTAGGGGQAADAADATRAEKEKAASGHGAAGGGGQAARGAGTPGGGGQAERGRGAADGGEMRRVSYAFNMNAGSHMTAWRVLA
jgi:hypothetical protein